MNGFAIRVKNHLAEKIPLEQALKCDAELVWVHLASNDEAVQRWLREEAHLSEYLTDMLTATETRPRCDAAPDGGALINMRGLSDDEMEPADPLASIRIYAHAGHVYSVSRKRLHAVGEVRDEVMARAEIDDPGDLIAEFASAITEELDPNVADLGDLLDDCEERLSADQAFEMRRRVNQVRIKAIGYRRFLNPQRSALEKLATLNVDWLEDDDRLHLAAAADRAARMSEELDSIRERSALIHETLTDLRAEQIDQRSLIIAIVAMVFLPLTFLTGLLGMNVEGIPYAREPWAFDGVLLVCALMAAGITIFFLYRHWFAK
ncbi:zinc transporter ZntB [Stakelama sediminis]|uniref:Zinc transporter n=1 Tax=Stakelama sediminis TaxID=463200 RepID=A0A840YWV3_9SPHN|nr:CorA family divalent cation transporter [Stakelama sediminis]MBB5718045.1 zinc transporter [Stakelama sediminis]